MSTDDRHVCHHCGYVRPAGATEVSCPNDETWLIEEREHLDARRDPLLGRTVGGRYPLLGVLGSGAMGTVYRSVQPLVERPVAVKVVAAAPDGTSLTDKRFLREAKAVASLDHPAIVTLYDFGVDPDGTAYMVMEQVRGSTLAFELDRGRFPPRLYVDLLLEVLGALQAAHAHGLVHRDLKPENVMVLDEPTPHTRVKVLDFGLAKLARPDESAPPLTGVGMVCGTPAFVAPEQLLGGEVDERSDVYAVGVMLYLGLTGRLPFEGGMLDVLRSHVHEPAPPLPDSFPAGLCDATAKALAKPRNERYQSAAELAAALQAVRGELPDDLDFVRTTRRRIAPAVSRSVPGFDDLTTAHDVSADDVPTERRQQAEAASSEAGTIEDYDPGDKTLLDCRLPGRPPVPEDTEDGLPTVLERAPEDTEDGVPTVLEPWSPPAQSPEPEAPEKGAAAPAPAPRAGPAAVAPEPPDDTITFVSLGAERTWGKWVLVALLGLGAVAGLVLLGGSEEEAAAPEAGEAPAAAKAPAAAGRSPSPTVLVLRSKPPGASVLQGGDVLGITPLTVAPKGAPGSRAKLRLLLRGHRPLPLRVTLDGTRQERDVALEPVGGAPGKKRK